MIKFIIKLIKDQTGRSYFLTINWRFVNIFSINRIFRYLTRVNFRLVITVGRFSSFSPLLSWKLSPSFFSNSCTLSSITSFVKKYVDSLSHKNKIQKHIVVIVEAWRIVAVQEWQISIYPWPLDEDGTLLDHLLLTLWLITYEN